MKTILLTAILLCSFAPSQRCTLLKNINNKKVSLFINSIYDDALIVQENTGAPLAIIIAQSCLETKYGQSRRCVEDCNYFAVKRNHEYMIYDSKEASFADYCKVMNQSCYLGLKPKTIDDWYRALVSCKYAESKEYVRKLKWIVKHFGLDKLK